MKIEGKKITSVNIFANKRHIFETLCNTDNVTLRLIEIIEIIPPVADNDSASIDISESVVIDLINGDMDPDGNLDLSTLTIVTPPQHGTLTNNGDGTVTYVHDGSNVSTDSFTYTIRDNDGLVSNTATVNIFIEIDQEFEIEVFNAVSPNNDGQNDILFIENIQFFENNRVIIFNRWGDEVYSASGYNNVDVAFDGRSNTGSEGLLPSGTYFYQINLGDGSSIVSGYLQLKR